MIVKSANTHDFSAIDRAELSKRKQNQVAEIVFGRKDVNLHRYNIRSNKNHKHIF